MVMMLPDSIVINPDCTMQVDLHTSDSEVEMKDNISLCMFDNFLMRSPVKNIWVNLLLVKRRSDVVLQGSVSSVGR